MHYSLRTERAYVHWVRTFIRFHDLRHTAGIFSAAGFESVNEDRIGVCRPLRICQVQGMTDGASVIGAVIHDVKENLLTRHAPRLSIDKLKVEGLIQLAVFQLRNVANEPEI